MSEYDDLFASPSPDDNKGSGGDSTYMFPDEDWVPGDLKGKPMKEGMEQLTSLRREMADQARTLAEMTKIAEQRKAAEQDEAKKVVQGNPLDTALDMLMDLKIENTVKDDPLLSKYKGEIRDILKQVRDPNIRMTEEALKMVVAQVRGAHYDEGIKLVEDKFKGGGGGSTQVDTAAVGGRYNPPAPAINVTPERKANLAAWFEGDLDTARRNLIGE